MDLPRMTVVISTRNRGDSVLRTIRTILLNGHPNCEVRIVDQSDDDVTERSLRPLLDNPCICYVRSATKGLSTGRNLGIRDAQSELIALTDDDCEVPSDWLRELVAAFAVDRRIGIVFGNVLPGPHDRSKGFVQAYVRTEPFLARSVCDKNQVEGTSACMGIRRSVWQLLGGFDEMLGLGAPLMSAEETDLTIRALLAGFFVYETPRVAIVHHGFQSFEKSLTLVHRNWYGTGAVFVKHLKGGQFSLVPLLFRLAWRWVFGRSRVASSLRPHSHRLLRLAAFARGFAAGATIPLDGTTGHFMCQC